MKKIVIVIREEDTKPRKKSPPPARPHGKATAYKRKPKYPKRDTDPGSGQSNDWPLRF